jgi:lysophospholipase L1-like esterase
MFFALFFSIKQIGQNGQNAEHGDVNSDLLTGNAISSLCKGCAVPISSFASVPSVSFASSDVYRTVNFGLSDDFVYRIAYISINGTAWRQFNMTGSRIMGSWVVGSATGNYNIPSSLVSTGNSSKNFIAVYSCKRAAPWDCHDGWQIRTFTTIKTNDQSEPKGPGLPGEINDSDDDVVVSSAKIVNVWASEYEANSVNFPDKTLDRVLSADSRWSSFGDGQWIAYALNQTTSVSYVRMVFYSTDYRTFFDVQYSTDNVVWKNTTAVGVYGIPAVQGTYQRFDFTPVNAKYIRIVGHGRSDPTLWNSIVEVDINGFAVALGSGQNITCTAVASNECYDGDVYWYDSCRVRGAKVADCNSSQTCSNGVCNNAEATSQAGMEIIYYNNFEQDTIGGYSSTDKSRDWTYCQPNPNSRIAKYAGDTQNPTNVFFHTFLKGEVSLSHITGAGFRCDYTFPKGYDEVYLSYKVKFGSGFDPVMGGKLPRIEASHEGNAGTCPNGTDFFTGGMMFKKNNGNPIPAFYLYYPDQWNTTWYRDVYYDITKTYPTSCKDFYTNSAVSAQLGGVYGETVYWNQTLNSGQWYTITERIVANTPGQKNGIAEGYINGKLVARKTDLRFRDTTNLKIDWIDFTSFFGGSGAEWATTKEEYIYFDDVIAYRYLSGSGEITGNVPRNTNTVPALKYPTASILNGPVIVNVTVNTSSKVEESKAKIADVWASSYQPDSNYVPRNTLDRNFDEESRWSAEGSNEWITYALNQTTTVNYVRLAFYYSTQRYFDIQYSTNNITWYNTTAKGLTSSANMASQYQTFSFTPVSAKYIRIVGHGSSAPSLWNSIVETDINGFAISLPASTTLTLFCGDGKCNNGETCSTCSNDCGGCTAPPTGATYAVIGDSMSDNVVVPATMGDWPGYFITKMGLSQSTVKVYAVSGNTCEEVYNQLANSVATGTTYLFVTCGVNGFRDINNTYWYQRIYNKAKEKGISRIYMTTMPPWGYINNQIQSSATTLCNKMKSENEWLKNFDSTHSDLQVVDLWTLWHDTSGTNKTDCGWRTDQSLTSDFLHPNSAGSEQWAQKYFELFQGTTGYSGSSSTATGAVIVYKNNFEQRPLGRYATLAEFQKDWNSGWGDRGEYFEVVTDPKGTSNKVGMATYPFYDVKDFKYVCWGDSRCGDSEGKRIYFSSWSQVPNQNLNGGILQGVGPGSGGGQWEIQLPAGPEKGGYKELYLSYRIKFSDGFNAVDGGKLPGFCGSDGTGVCPGGGTTTLNSAGNAFRFSARMMFEASNPIFYMYFPNRNGAGTDDGYGAGQSWSKDFKDGQWHTVVQRIVLNDLNVNNGVVEAWLDGERVSSQGGYAFRIGSQSLFGLNRVYFSTFFGGDDRRCTDSQVSAGTRGCAKYSDGTNYLWYAPRKTEKIYFDNIVVYYYNSSSSVVKGNQPSPANRVEIPPTI